MVNEQVKYLEFVYCSHRLRDSAKNKTKQNTWKPFILCNLLYPEMQQNSFWMHRDDMYCSFKLQYCYQDKYTIMFNLCWNWN